MTINHKDILDLMEWRSLSQAMNLNSQSIIPSPGAAISQDYRNRDYASPLYFFQAQAGSLGFYNTKSDAWALSTISMGMGGSFGAGATSTFCPSLSPTGTISAGATTSSFTLTTALAASVNANQLTNRGDGKGFIVRVIGNGAGSSGKIEERRVIGNTSGTTPTIYLDKPLSFTPTSGDRYEFLSGSVVFLNIGALVANQFRRYDILTNSFSQLSTTNLVANVQATHNQLISMDEQYVPADRNVGEGYVVGAATYDTAGDWVKKCLTATATSATSITGQVSGGDVLVKNNYFRNFQIRIVEDTSAPTAVGQRRLITANTGNVYTVATWTVTPSATCKFVIENCTDNLIGFMGGATVTYNYKITNYCGGTANTWDAGTTWGARAAAMGAGGITWAQFGVPYDPNGVIKPCQIYSIRSTTQYDLFDITGAATGTWTSNLSPLNLAGTSNFNSWTMANDYSYFAYNPHTQNGKYAYYFAAGSSGTTTTQRPCFRMDLQSGMIEAIAGPKQVSLNTQAPYGQFAFTTVYQEVNDKIAFYNSPRPLGTNLDFLQLMLTR
jgi:hypothetical protein